MSAGGACRCMLSVLLNTAATTANPQNAPSNDQNAPKIFPTSCFCSFRYPRNLDMGVGSLCNGEAGMTRFRYRSMSRCQLSAFLSTLILNRLYSKSFTNNEQEIIRSINTDIKSKPGTRSKIEPSCDLRISECDRHCAIFRPGAIHTSFGPEPSPTPSLGC